MVWILVVQLLGFNFAQDGSYSDLADCRKTERLINALMNDKIAECKELTKEWGNLPQP